MRLHIINLHSLVVPYVTNQQHIPLVRWHVALQANLDVMSWELSDEDYRALSNLTCQMRMVNGSFWLHPKGPYKVLQDLWDDTSDTEENQL